jgi:ABC-type multidrug transport system fused ATPase/permease subunit
MSKIEFRIKESLFYRSLFLLTPSDKRKIKLVLLIQMLMSFLDLLGVALMGVLGALAVNGIQSRPPGDRVSWILDLLNLSSLTLQTQASVLGISAMMILLSKTLFTAVYSRKTLYFLSRKSADLTYGLLSRYLSGSLIHMNEKSSQQTLFALTNGVNTVMVGIVGATLTFITDSTLLIIMLAGLLVVDINMALGAITLFGSTGIFLYFTARKRAERLGAQSSSLIINSNEKIIELFVAYREVVVRNRRHFYARAIGDSRIALSNVWAEISFLPSISKYVVETVVVLGAGLLAVVQFTRLDATHAVATLTVFLAAGTRITPALLRIQQSALTIKGASGISSSTLEMIDSLKDIRPIENTIDDVQIDHKKFTPKIKIENVSFTYPNSHRNALENLSLEIMPGQKVAIVGPSGAGKTTLVDVLLGLIPPTSGSISISEKSPLSAINEWPGAIAYVPQDVTIFNSTILENVALGFPVVKENEALATSALAAAQLTEFVDQLPKGLFSPVGDRGTKLSGGQRQRLGIARALFTKPKLIILDEATSSLDGQTEFDISQSILGLDKSVTVVMIAHRLSTVMDSDLVVYLDQGQIKARGTFSEVREKIRDFDSQAKLMGL